MVRRVIVALLSICIFSLLFLVVSYSPDPEYQAVWGGFWAPLPIVLTFVVPAYIFGAIPASILIDRKVKGLGLQSASYLVAGFIAGSVIGGISFGIEGFVGLGLFGVIGAFLFFILDVLVKFSLSSLKKKK